MMMRSVFRTLLMGSVGLMVASCAQSDLVGEPAGGSGPMSRVAFSASVNPQYSLSYASAETSGVDLDQIAWPVASDFALDILSGDKVVESHAAGTVPSELELAVGAYRVRAHSGVNGESWNTPYLEGTQEFALSSSATSVNAKLTCGLKSTLVALVFDENFSTIFSDYTAYLNTDHTKEAWVWTAGEKRVASMRPTEQLLIRVDVTMRSTGSKYNYGVNPLVDLKAGELNIVRFSMVGGEVTATITSDNTVTVVEKTVALDPDWLAKRKTSISATFDPTVALENTYGLPYTTPTDVVVRSNVGLKSLKLTAGDDLVALLGVNEVDLRAINNVEAKTGLVLTKNEATMVYDGRLNFKGCLNTLPVLTGDASAYTFTVEAVDLLNEVSTFQTTINISLPELGSRSVDGSKVWNRYAKVPGVPVTDARVPAEYRETFVFEYVIREGDGPWESIGKHVGTADIYKGGLKPATTYTTAVDLGDDRYVAQASFTTDVEPQIPNSDFAQSALPPQANGNIGAYYEPMGWATLNALTTQNYSTSAKASQAYPCVKIENGAAVLTSRGWGAGNRIQHSLTFHAWLGGVDQWGNATIQNATAGKLFLGSFNSGATDPETNGILFSKKPKQIRFQYQYQSKAQSAWEMELRVMSGDTEIGRAYMSNSDNKSELAQLQIEYHLATLTLNPTSIQICFVGEKIAPVANTTSLSIIGKDKPGGVDWKGKPSWIDTSESYFEGAKLTIDDVELVYLQDITDSYTTK